MSQSGESAQPSPDDPSLDQLADDLAGVEQALEGLEDGSYWIDTVLSDDPTARRAPPPSDPAP